MKKAVEEQEAYIAKRASDCTAFLQQVKTTIATLDAMRVHLLAKSTQSEQQAAPPAVQEVAGATVPSDKLAELHKILDEAKLPSEVAQKLRDSVNTVLAPTAQASTYGKAAPGASPAAQVAQIGPYQQVPPDGKKAEAGHTGA